MLLTIKTPKLLDSSILIESSVESRFHLPHVRLDAYYTLERTARYLNLSPERAFKFMVKSRIVHGAMHDSKLYVHPRSVFRYMRMKARKGMKTAMKEQFLVQ